MAGNLQGMLLICTMAVLCIFASSSPIQIVSVDGNIRSSGQINSFLASLENPDVPCSFNGILDCGDSEEDLINAAFDTKFGIAGNGISLDLAGSSACLYTTFDSITSQKFCGSKAIDYIGSVCSNAYVVLSGKNIAAVLSGYDQIFRRLLSRTKEAISPVESLTFLVKDSEFTSEQDKKDILAYLENVWEEVHDNQKPSASLQSLISVEVICADVSNLNVVRSAISSKASSVNKSKLVAVSAIGGLLTDAWTRIPVGAPRPILSPSRRRSLMEIESAYATAISQIEAIVTQWQARVGSGKVVGKFGERVGQLASSVHQVFTQNTAGSLAVRERSERARQVDDYLQAAVSELFRQQLSILQAKALNRFRKTLSDVVAVNDEPNSEEEQQALRKALFDFTTDATDLEVDQLSLSSTAAQNEVSVSLQNLAKSFPETAAARLEAVRKLEKQAKRPSKKKGQRSVNIALNLVGMLRPPGFGNLQGFVGYSTGLLGLPLELLLGVQNDGDSPEIVGEDREFPILRLQPKVHFDIDV